jgi:hypothetical protein
MLSHLSSLTQLKLGLVRPVLRESLEPPDIDAVSAALKNLTSMGTY